MKQILTALENIKSRGRSYEQGIETEYLDNLSKSYFEYFKQEQSLKFLVIDTNGIDFVKNNKDFDPNRILETVKELCLNSLGVRIKELPMTASKVATVLIYTLTIIQYMAIMAYLMVEVSRFG